jgi:nitrate/nitrite-specific signal transduction histidine kinase
VVIELDRRIEQVRASDRTNPSAFRKGIIAGYQDIREFIQNIRKTKGELP